MNESMWDQVQMRLSDMAIICVFIRMKLNSGEKLIDLQGFTNDLQVQNERAFSESSNQETTG